MTFEPIVIADDPGSGNPPSSGARFTLDQASLVGQTFTVTFRVCFNPCCPCGAVEFHCRSEALPDQSVSFQLDVFEPQLNTQVHSTPDGVALGRAFLAEARDAQWEWLRKLFLETKRRQMEKIDLDTLDARLPDDLMSGDSTMISYREVFPWSDALAFAFNGQEWFVDDYNCVSPGCACTQSGLAFFLVPKKWTAGPKSFRSAPFLFYDYVTSKPSGTRTHRGSPAPEDLLQALCATNAGLRETLRHRHGQLKRLGRRLLPKSRQPFSGPKGTGWDPATEAWLMQPPAPEIARALDRPGRNDPCSCGSGKKFKKCCGA